MNYILTIKMFKEKQLLIRHVVTDNKTCCWKTQLSCRLLVATKPTFIFITSRGTMNPKKPFQTTGFQWLGALVPRFFTLQSLAAGSCNVCESLMLKPSWFESHPDKDKTSWNKYETIALPYRVSTYVPTKSTNMSKLNFQIQWKCQDV